MTQVLILHGTAERSVNFASSLVSNIGKTSAMVSPTFYGDLFQPKENAVNAKLNANIKWRHDHLLKILDFPVRDNINQFISDVFMWDTSPTTRDCISLVVKQQIKEHPLILVVHSFGAVVALSKQTDLWPILNCSVLITLGCPIYWYDWEDNLNKVTVPWFNFYHEDDLIGAPLSTLYSGCEDIEVKDAGPSNLIVGGGEIAFALQAHNCYFDSKQVADKIKEFI